jgi:hypothetical protein
VGRPRPKLISVARGAGPTGEPGQEAQLGRHDQPGVFADHDAGDGWYVGAQRMDSSIPLHHQVEVEVEQATERAQPRVAIGLGVGGGEVGTDEGVPDEQDSLPGVEQRDVLAAVAGGRITSRRPSRIGMPAAVSLTGPVSRRGWPNANARAIGSRCGERRRLSLSGQVKLAVLDPLDER